MATFEVKEWIVLILGLTLGMLTLLRMPTAIRGRNMNMFAAHGLITVCVLLTVEPVYLAADRILGGYNFANALSHLCFPFIFMAGGLQTARGLVRPDLAGWIVGRLGITVLAASIAGTLISFGMLGSTETSMGLDQYRDNPWVVLYKAAGFLYCFWVAAVLFRPLLRTSRDRDLPRYQSVAQFLLGVAFLMVMCLPWVHLMEFIVPSIARPLADVLVYGSIVLAAISPTTAFVVRTVRGIRGRASSRSGPERPSPSRRRPDRQYGRAGEGETSRSEQKQSGQRAALAGSEHRTCPPQSGSRASSPD